MGVLHATTSITYHPPVANQASIQRATKFLRIQEASLSSSLSVSMCSFLLPMAFFPERICYGMRDAREEHGNIETIAKRPTIIVRYRCTRCQVLFPCRSKCVLWPKEQDERNLILWSSMISIRKSFWNLYFIEIIGIKLWKSNFETKLFEFLKRLKAILRLIFSTILTKI